MSSTKDNLRIDGPATTTGVRISKRNASLAKGLLDLFAPDGNPTVDRSSPLRLTCVHTGRSVDFPATSVGDVASLIHAFAVQHLAPKKPHAAVETPASLGKLIPRSAETASSGADGTAGAPTWIRQTPEFRGDIVCDDGDFTLYFTGLRMNARSKYMVDGKAPGSEAGAWGFDVVADGAHFGWVVISGPECFIVTGVEKGHSKHRTLMAARFRIASHLQARRQAAD